jgi:hypothetical protein
MFLSNLFRAFLLAAVCACLLQGCGSTQSNQTTHAPVPVERKGEYPFETREPDTYRGEFVIDGREGDRTVVTRKGDRWRRDHYHEGEIMFTELKSDKLYAIDHKRKIYAEAPSTIAKDPFNEMTFDYFKGKGYREFDEVGRSGSIVKYKVRQTPEMKDDVFLDFDETSGLIVRQEFKGHSTDANTPAANYLFEIRNLTLTVDDSNFELPAGYQKIDWDKYQPPAVVLPEDESEEERGREKRSEHSSKSEQEREHEREREHGKPKR